MIGGVLGWEGDGGVSAWDGRRVRARQMWFLGGQFVGVAGREEQGGDLAGSVAVSGTPVGLCGDYWVVRLRLACV